MKGKGSVKVKGCCVLLLLFFFTAISKGQINIFEAPTAEVSEEGCLFFQQGVKISDRNIQASTIFTWGLGKNFQAGFNISQLTFNTRPHSKSMIIEPQQPKTIRTFLSIFRKV